MTSNRLCLLVLCSFVILGTFISSSQSASCCLMYTRQPVQCRRILGYTTQTINTSCDINAIIFHVRGGRFVCADPSSPWTRKRLDCLQKRRDTPILRETTRGTKTPKQHNRSP